MAEREQMGQQIAPGVIARISAGLSYVVRGITPNLWMSPNQPIAPLVQDQTVGRQFDFEVGYNLRIQPREGQLSFAALRSFADSYDLLRLVIETRKDQVEAYEWEIVPKDEDAPKGTLNDEIRAATEFLEMPDKQHLWPQWLRGVMEEMFVIDAMSFYPRTDMGGHLYALELLDGATIKRVIDEYGRTPLPPSVAYQQVLHGVPANDLTTDDLLYQMRNPRVNHVYGYSPVEQVLTTVNIALRRQLTQLDSYTQGTIPEALAQVPETWNAKMIGDFQAWFNGVMSGNTAARQKITFIPKLENILFPRAQVLKDEYDEWLARIICFAFSISPTALIKNPNRSTSESMADTAKEEGLLPLLKFISAMMTQLIGRFMLPGLKFQFKEQVKVDPMVTAKIHSIYYTMEALTPNEIRADIGREPLTEAQRKEAFPMPPLPLAGYQQPPSELDDDPGNDGPKPAKPKTKQEAKPPAEKLLEGLELHIHAPPVTVDAPVTLGDTHTHVSVPGTTVQMHGGTTIQQPAVPLRKTVRTWRDPDTGVIHGEATHEPDLGALDQMEKIAKETVK